ncbi:MAG: hypothetical protein JWN62_953, partial [Acidimicrobiales bacterium]|nr:hypothetical protein [Acidimicrobiales bacterium]
MCGLGLFVAASFPTTAALAAPLAPAVVDCSAQEAPGGSIGYVALNPTRVLDTRTGGTTADGVGAGIGPIGERQTLNLKVIGRAGIPSSNVGAVVLNVTAVDQAVESFLTIYPAGADRPLASNLNPNPGIVEPNLVIAKVGVAGEISIYNNTGSVNVIADVEGWYPAPLGVAYNPLVPARVLETRPGHATTDGVASGLGAVGQGQTLTFKVLGRGGVPDSGVAAVVLNMTATEQTRQTFLTVFPSGTTRPNASDLNPNPGVTAPNLVIAKVGADGNVSVYNNTGSVQIIADVQGWFPVGPAYTPVDPARLLETRPHLPTIDGLAQSGGAIGPGGSINLQVTGRGGVPATGVSAVVLNITATNQTESSFLTVYPAGTARPATSNLNPLPGLVAPNLVLAKVGVDGEITIYNNTGSLDVIVDVHGWFPTDGTAKPSSTTASIDAGAPSVDQSACVNQAPSFTKGPDQVVDVDAGPQSVTGWASAISAGGTADAPQTIDFIVSASNPALFSAVPAVSPTGVLTYTPAAGQSGVSTVTVRLHDNGGTANGGVDTSDAQTFTIGVNGAPTVADQTVGTNEDTAQAIVLTGVDPDHNALTFSIVAAPTKGNLGTIGAPACNVSTGACVATVSYTPNPQSNGSDQFTYRTNDGRLNSTTATVSIGVIPVNDVPSFVKGSDVSLPTTTVTGWATAISAGPVNEAGQVVDFIVTNDAPTLFSVQPAVSAAGDLSFTPAPGKSGVANVTVKIHDNGGTANGGVDTSAAQTFVINVDTAPTANAVTTTVLEDGSAAITLSGGDAEGDSLSFSIVTGPTSGSLGSIGAPSCAGVPSVCTASVTYTPNPNINGSDSFTYRVKDASVFSSAATVSITITSVNDAPVGANKTVSTTEGIAYTFGTADFPLTDPNDSPANALKAVGITTPPAAGTLTDNGAAVIAGQSIPLADITGGLLVFTPAANGNGTPYATFTFQVQDDGGTANGGVDADQSANTLTINVSSVNNPPAGTDASISTLEDTSRVFTASDFGFTDPLDTPANSLSAVKITTLPAAGSLTDNGTAVTAGQLVSVADITAGHLTFMPATNANGAAYTSFTFQVQDDGGTANGGVDLDQSANKITIDVTSVNDAPTGTSGSVTILEDGTKVFSTADFGFADASDNPANSLAAVIVKTLPSAGSLLDNGAVVTLNQSIPVADIAANKLTFTPDTNANGTGYASFTFVVRDDGGTLNSGVDVDQTARTMSINVTAVNDAPVGTNHTVTGVESTSYQFAATDFGFTDPTDAPANSLSAVKITTLPAPGTLTDNGGAVVAGQSIPVADITGGLLQFTPVANGHGPGYASFTFQVQDNGGTANGGVDLDPSARTMTIDVDAINDAPAGTNTTVNATEDTPYVFAAANFGFTDPNDTPPNALSAVKIATLPTAGTLTDNSVAVTAGQLVAVADIDGGLLVFTPVANANGATYATFTFQVQDDGGTAHGGTNLDPSANTLTIAVASVNDAPVGADKTVSTAEDTPYVFASSDFALTDPNDLPANAFAGVKITTVPTGGTLRNGATTLAAGAVVSKAAIDASSFTYTPNANANGAGQGSFTFQVQDNGGVAGGGVDLDQSPNTI